MVVAEVVARRAVRVAPAEVVAHRVRARRAEVVALLATPEQVAPRVARAPVATRARVARLEVLEPAARVAATLRPTAMTGSTAQPTAVSEITART